MHCKKIHNEQNYYFFKCLTQFAKFCRMMILNVMQSVMMIDRPTLIRLDSHSRKYFAILWNCGKFHLQIYICTSLVRTRVKNIDIIIYPCNAEH